MSRIIAGSAKGTTLAAPRGEATRPTTDRTKEALFSSLASWFGTADQDPAQQLAGVAVLDLFAGTGGVGLEAASRGAAPVVLVDHRTAPLIRDNARRAKVAVDVRAGKAMAVVAGLVGRFDLAFLDPPYDLAGEQVDRLLTALVDRLDPEALVVVERSRRVAGPTWPAAFADTWRRDYGETTLHFGATEGQSQG